MREIYLGPPGTGKTTTLLNEVDRALQAGIAPQSIAFLAFNRSAATEARWRAQRRFGLGTEDLPNFRTVHSFAMRQSGIRAADLLQRNHLRELGRELGVEFGFESPEEDSLVGMPMGDRLLFLSNLARITVQPLRKVFEASDAPDLNWHALQDFDRRMRLFLRERSLFDFTGVLEECARRDEYPELQLLIVDESQDLSRRQWMVAFGAEKRARRSIFAGDDDQAIYRWAGADLTTFLSLPGHTTVLEHSYRLPRAVWRLATSTAAQIRRRREKKWYPRKAQGAVEPIADIEQVDLSSGTWLLLARHRYLIRGFETACYESGTLYERLGSEERPTVRAVRFWERWCRGEALPRDQVLLMLRYVPRSIVPRTALRRVEELPADAAVIQAGMKQLCGVRLPPGPWAPLFTAIPASELRYLVRAQERGEDFHRAPRIRISTIHQAKGLEADHVVLRTDISRRTAERQFEDPDDELRVLYVALTRARENVYWIEPRTRYSYGL